MLRTEEAQRLVNIPRLLDERLQQGGGGVCRKVAVMLPVRRHEGLCGPVSGGVAEEVGHPHLIHRIGQDELHPGEAILVQYSLGTTALQTLIRFVEVLPDGPLDSPRTLDIQPETVLMLLHFPEIAGLRAGVRIYIRMIIQSTFLPFPQQYRASASGPRGQSRKGTPDSRPGSGCTAGGRYTAPTPA